MSGEPDEQGFTLIETIIALMVVAVATVMLMQIYASVSTAGGQAARILRAVEIARNQLELASTGAPLEAGGQSGETADGFDWRLDIAPYDSAEDSGDIVLMRLDVTVRKAGRGEILAGLTTLRPAGRAEK